jgi:hypothetical protein
MTRECRDDGDGLQLARGRRGDGDAPRPRQRGTPKPGVSPALLVGLVVGGAALVFCVAFAIVGAILLGRNRGLLADQPPPRPTGVQMVPARPRGRPSQVPPAAAQLVSLSNLQDDCTRESFGLQ